MEQNPDDDSTRHTHVYEGRDHLGNPIIRRIERPVDADDFIPPRAPNEPAGGVGGPAHPAEAAAPPQYAFEDDHGVFDEIREDVAPDAAGGDFDTAQPVVDDEVERFVTGRCLQPNYCLHRILGKRIARIILARQLTV